MEYTTCAGGAREYTAGWDKLTSNSYLTSNGKAKDGMVYFSKNGSSDRTKTAFSSARENGYGEDIQTIYRIGDAIKETWIDGAGCWFNNSGFYVYEIAPFSARGEYYGASANAGVFAATNFSGGIYNMFSFRTVLIGE